MGQKSPMFSWRGAFPVMGKGPTLFSRSVKQVFFPKGHLFRGIPFSQCRILATVEFSSPSGGNPPLLLPWQVVMRGLECRGPLFGVFLSDGAEWFLLRTSEL